jgi:RNA-directed DNA polymerase
VDYIRSADDMVILVHGHPSEDRLLRAVQRRLKEELDKLQVQMNQGKTKVVNLKEGGCFSFLGFDIRLNRNREGKIYVRKTPRIKKRKEIGIKVKAVLKAHHDKPLKEVIQAVNRVVRGWVNYFRVGNSSSTFDEVRSFIEKKVRRFVMRRKGRKGFGWKRWSREDIYKKWGLYNDYHIRYLYLKAAPGR